LNLSFEKKGGNEIKREDQSIGNGRKPLQTVTEWLSYIDERVLVHAAYFLATMTSESVQSKVHNMND